ncbi:MAG: beta-lactamase family protein [Planctomycetes bacterium]|nr:beta-lactamase family protein [Planctomycetota bacterium]
MKLAFLLLLFAGQDEPRDAAELLRPVLRKHDLPGMIGMVVRGDGTILVQGVAGVRKRGAKAIITVDDLFHVGSCTKSMTATMIATLVDEGKLKWTTTIGDVFDDVEMHDDWKSVTLELLLTNRSGAPGDLDKDGLWGKLWGMAGEAPAKQRRALVEGVLKNPPACAPGTKYVYSNAGFAIAGAMTEKTTGEAWEDLMRRRLFEPLGMKSASFGAPGTKGRIDQPLGHTSKGAPVEPGIGADNPAAIGPAGTVCVSFADWAKYVALHVRFDPNGSREAAPGMEKLLESVKPETLAFLHEPPKDANPKYAKGWLLCERAWAGGPALTHDGSNTMWYVVAWLAPKRDFAVLVGVNQGGDKASKAADEAAWALIQSHLKK